MNVYQTVPKSMQWMEKTKAKVKLRTINLPVNIKVNGEYSYNKN